MKQEDTLWRRIYAELKDEVVAGKFVKGERLPTEKELTARYAVSRITAKKAMDQLAEDGVIIRIAGRGSFIAADFPQQIASQQAGRRMIALVMGGYTAAFGLEIINGAVRRAEELGCHLIVKETGNSQERETRALSHLKEAGVAGAIIQPAHGELYNPWLLGAVYNRYPIVMLDRQLPGIDVPYVGVDNVKLSRQIANELFRRGHRNIALVMLEDDYSSSLKDRSAGFIEASLEAGVPVRKGLWCRRLVEEAQAAGLDKNDPASYEVYVQAIAEHLKRHPEITAIYGTEYTASMAAWDAARKIGRKIPEDISIVSFDFNTGSLGFHTLTHVEQPQQELGRIVLPLCLPILATLGLFTIVGYWNSYFSAIIYITKRTKWPLQLVLRELLFESSINEMQNGIAAEELETAPFLLKMASIVVATLPIMLIYPFLQRYFTTGLVLGGVKE